jgi:peptidoglycan hydrolase CwlO-like protein
MVKRGLVATAIGAGLLGLTFGTAAPSYVKTAFHKARHSVKGSVPTEFEIERARNEIAALDPAIDSGIETLARALGEVDQLKAEIASSREELNKQGSALQALNEQLKRGDIHLTSGGAYTERTVKNTLAQGMDRYKVLKATLTEKQETLGILQNNVESARQGLDALKAAKQDLTARVDGAQARLNQIKAARATHKYSFDDSAIGQAKRTVSELEKSLDQMSRVDELKEKYLETGTTITVDPTRDVTREIEAEFNSAPKTEKIGEKF